ncbi:MAG: hypothetical protein JXB00_14200 [Bacteroidales bacterium]|nr:hypothetical protein [Bacteroidales bacterium]
MIKKAIILFTISTMFFSAFGQSRIGAALLLSTPKSDTYIFGSGIGFNAKFNITERLAVGAVVSYEHFFNKPGWEDVWEAEWGYNYRNNNRNIAQLHPTITYFLSQNKVKAYIGFEAGVTFEFVSYEYKSEYDSYSRWLKADNTETSLSFSPVFGLEIPASQTISFDLFIKYTGVDVSYLTAGVGLAFVIK